MMRKKAVDSDGKAAGSLQTLDRGLQALMLISQAVSGLTIPELADRLGVHRTIVYRIAATLQQHGLATRCSKGQLRLGAGIVALSQRFQSHLRETAQPLLERLANESGAAAFLSVAQGSNYVAIMAAEPEGTALRVAYRIGSCHALSRGAAGIAILAGRPEAPNDAEVVRQARRDGYILTRGEIQPGAIGLASPLRTPKTKVRSFEASVAIATLGDLDERELASFVMTAAADLRAALGVLD